MAKDWKLYALHVLDCVEKIQLIHQRGDIADDFILYDAVLRNLQVLSESTSHFPESIRNKYSDMNWKGINGFRNILVHDYLGDIDPETIKKIISDYLPELEKTVRKILSELPSGDSMLPK